MKRTLISAVVLFLTTSVMVGQISPGGWEKIYTNLDGVAHDLEKTAFGYTFVIGSGRVGPDQYQVYSPTTLVAVNNSGNIIWQITNNDLVMNPDHKIVFAGHNDSTNSYIFLVAGYGEYNDTSAMQLWPVSADYNPGTQTWSVNSLPVKTYIDYSSYFPSDLIYYESNKFMLVGFLNNSYGRGFFHSQINHSGIADSLYQGWGCYFSEFVCCKYNDELVMVASQNNLNNYSITIMVYDDVNQIYPDQISYISTSGNHYLINSITMKYDTILLGSVVSWGRNISYHNIIKTNKSGYLFNHYSYGYNNGCKKMNAIIDNNNEYLTVGGSLYPGDSLSPPWCGGFYMKNYSDFSFKSTSVL
ncbi:hypothetical protein JXL83_01765 [candidate division WOR-3 bacterium]|nr:hypothetical protein [candidate division WOR-3 bacterium]